MLSSPSLRLPKFVLPPRPVALVYCGLVFAALAGLYVSWSARVDSAVRQADMEVRRVAIELGAVTHAVVSQLEMLRTVADIRIGLPANLPAMPQLGLLESLTDASGYRTRVPRTGESAPDSYLFGAGELPSASSTVHQEANAAISLNPLLQVIRQNNADVAWAYYTSAQKFTNLQPYEPDIGGEPLRWSEEFLAHPLFSDHVPPRNPAREVRWQSAYIDQAGKGLMTTASAPVYDPEGRFRGVVAIDLTLAALADYLGSPERHAGYQLIVHDNGQVLGYALSLGHTGQQPAEVPTLSHWLPPQLADSAARRLATGDAAVVTEGGWRSARGAIADTPWQVVSLIDLSRLGWETLAVMRMEAVGLFLILALLVAFERRRQADAALQASQAQLARVLDGSEQGFWEWDIRRRVLTVSARLEAMLGYAPGERPLTPDNWTDHVHPEDVDRVRDSITGNLNGSRALHESELRALTKSGEWVWVRCSGNVVSRSSRGKPLMMSGTLTDISTQKRTEAELIIARRMADSANAGKSRFLAAASHDLRQPMQAINMLTYVLKDSGLTENQAKVVANISLATQSLGDLLEGLLDISKLDAGAISPQRGPVGLEDVFRRLDGEFAQTALNRGLRFKLWYPRAGGVVVSDPRLLQSVLRNLLSNALKFTDTGGVLVAARFRPTYLLFQVWDTGKGIAPELQSRVFEEFFQVAQSHRDRHAGLGLGLSIARRLCTLLGYELSCHSQPGKGSVFEVRVPWQGPQPLASAAPTEAGAAQDADTTALEKRLLFIIEDNPAVANAVGVWLRGYGMDVRIFASGESALADPQVLDADAYLTDFSLVGGMDGVAFLNEVAARKAAASAPAAAVRAVLMTGNTAPEHIDRFANLPWPVLYKPVEPGLLVASLCEVLQDGLDRRAR